MKTSLSILFGALLSIALFALPASAQSDSARIHLIHGIPGVEVDVIVDGQPVFENFAFEDTQDLSSMAGTTLTGLKVNVAGTEDTVIDAGDVALPASGNYSIVAHLDADGNPALSVFENDTSKIDAGQGRLVVRHAAAAPAVDIKANGAVAFADVPNGSEGAADLPAGTISAEVVPTGESEPVVIGPADLPITEGSELIVYAVGSLDDGLQVITESIDGLGDTPAALNTGNSPIEDDSAVNPLALAGVAAAVVVGVGLFATKKVKG